MQDGDAAPEQVPAQQQQGPALSEAALAHMLGEESALEPNLAWAGASHWRYRTRGATAAKPAGSSGATEPAPAKAPRKYVFYLLPTMAAPQPSRALGTPCQALPCRVSLGAFCLTAPPACVLSALRVSPQTVGGVGTAHPHAVCSSWVWKANSPILPEQAPARGHDRFRVPGACASRAAAAGGPRSHPPEGRACQGRHPAARGCALPGECVRGDFVEAVHRAPQACGPG